MRAPSATESLEINKKGTTHRGLVLEFGESNTASTLVFVFVDLLAGTVLFSV